MLVRPAPSATCDCCGWTVNRLDLGDPGSIARALLEHARRDCITPSTAALHWSP